MNIELNQEDFFFKISYEKRKSMSLHMDTAGMFQVKAPKGTPEEQIIAFVKNKSKWIAHQQSNLENQLKAITADPPKSKSYQTGETFLYLGKPYTVTIHSLNSNESNRIELHDGELVIFTSTDDPNQLRDVLTRYYYKCCKKIVAQRLEHYKKILNVKFKSFSIEDSPVKWGSCDSNKHLMFNWRLVMADVSLIDYIVVHELCHLEHMNHSRSFWRLVGKVMPDYEKRQYTLQCLNQLMTL